MPYARTCYEVFLTLFCTFYTLVSVHVRETPPGAQLFKVDTERVIAVTDGVSCLTEK